LTIAFYPSFKPVAATCTRISKYFMDNKPQNQRCPVGERSAEASHSFGLDIIGRIDPASPRKLSEKKMLLDF
jgi:hypothetical protein